MTDPFARLERAVRTLPEWVIAHWPGRVGQELRRLYWKPRLGAMGERCVIEVGVNIQGAQHVFLGDDVWLDSYVQLVAGPPAARENLRVKPNPRYRGGEGQVRLAGGNHVAAFCVLQGHGGLWIGRDVGIASHSMIYTLSNHYRAGSGDNTFDGDYDKVVKFAVHGGARRAYIASPVVLEDASAIGLNSVVLPGSTVGRFSWIATASVVQGEVPEGVIAGGNPLRILKQRFDGPPEGRSG
jgi:acetyltransferase-like isoleucine patch superfamily enzyme